MIILIKSCCPYTQTFQSKRRFDAKTGKCVSSLHWLIHLQLSLNMYTDYSLSLSLFLTKPGKLLCGPVIFKLDSGPGRIVASIKSVLKRERVLRDGIDHPSWAAELNKCAARNARSLRDHLSPQHMIGQNMFYWKNQWKRRDRGRRRQGDGLFPPEGAPSSILSWAL
jgi:hypothetical protein